MAICPTHRLPMDVSTTAGAGQPALMCERCHSGFLDAEMARWAKRQMKAVHGLTLDISITPTGEISLTLRPA